MAENDMLLAHVECMYEQLLARPQPYIKQLVLVSDPLEIRVYVALPSINATVVCRDHDIPSTRWVRVIHTTRGPALPHPAVETYTAYTDAFHTLATSSLPSIYKVVLTGEHQLFVYVNDGWLSVSSIRHMHKIPAHVRLHVDFTALPAYAPSGAICSTQ
jgi:hypothetical protein